MSKNKKKIKQTTQARQLPSLPTHLIERFDIAYEHIENEEWDEALDILLDIEKARPDFPGIETALALVAQSAGEYAILERCFRKMAERSPKDPDIQLQLGSAYLLNNHIALGYRQLSTFVAIHPDQEQGDMFREMLKESEPELDRRIADIPLPREEAIDFLAISENTEFHLGQNELGRSLTYAETAARKWPNFGAGHTLRSVIELASGQLAASIDSARRGVELAPESGRALAVLVRALVTAGRIDEARTLAEGFSSITIATLDDLDKTLFALTFVGNEPLLVEIYEKYGPAIEGALEIPSILHIAATAYAVLNREREARELWTRALDIDPEFFVARTNLMDLDREPGKKNGPYAFPLLEWLTREAYQDIIDLRNLQGHTNEAASRAGRKVLRKHPELTATVPHILVRCSDGGVALLANFIVLSDDPNLLRWYLEFLAGPRGSDSLRITCYVGLLFDRIIDTPTVPLWRNGELDPSVPVETLMEHVTDKLRAIQQAEGQYIEELEAQL